ncbi:MAG TPA: tRNA (guanine(46)-N(7))-methyltransferase TrmB, partial [Waddliaceae bacterium]
MNKKAYLPRINIAILFHSMKPKALQAVPFKERRPLLEDQVFFVPIHYTGYEHFTLPDLSIYFGNDHPVSVEFCSGNGDWIIEKAKLDPSKNWIAVEKRFDRVKKIWSKLKNHHLSNLLIVCGEACTFAHYYLLSDKIEEVYINFPDPWPKMKHAKHRLMQSIFLDELSRILMPGKKVTVVTDDFSYLQS